MTIIPDPVNGVWVAMGAHNGIPYLAEGATPEDAEREAIICAAERHGERVEVSA